MIKGTGITHGLALPNLLGLTPQLRHKIYVQLLLVVWYDGPRVFELNGVEDYLKSTIGFYGLLLSCRTLYNEFSALLYSGSRFIIRYSYKGSLQSLRQLSETSLAHLTSLKIVLKEFSCHSRAQNIAGLCCLRDNDCYLYPTDDHHHDGFDRHEKTSWGSISWTTEMLQEWELTAEHLSSRIASTKLDLSVVYDVFDEEDSTVALRAVAPIYLLSPLKDCHIRLSMKRNHEIQHIAQHAVLQAKGILQAAGPKLSPVVAPSELRPSTSRLLRLPHELRFRILEYTDLITPWREVIWSKQRHAYITSMIDCSLFRDLKCAPDFHHGCQFRDCERTYHTVSIGCFCRTRHSAFSSSCKCWAPPTSLFLICRRLLADARVVFFSSNRFVVPDLNYNQPSYAPERCKYPNETFAATQFLRGVVPSNCLSHLRFLEFAFPPYGSDGWPPDEYPALQEWADTIEWLRPQIHAPDLTIRLVISEPNPWDLPDERRDMIRAAGPAIIGENNRVMMTLAPLFSDHLRSFYAQFTCPWAGDYPPATLVWPKEEELDKRARHDEMVRRRDPPPPSIWLHRFEGDA